MFCIDSSDLRHLSYGAIKYGVVTQCSVLIAAICVIYLVALYGAIKYGVVTQCSVY